jgi:RHS repeat-associated protein
MRRTQLLLVLVLVGVLAPSVARAAEVCGNGTDDDSDAAVDEGCFSSLIAGGGQCESPLSCEDTGYVSPKLGNLHYSLPPDVSPRVPWGPGISYGRYYMSLYSPGGSAPVWQKPLGERWGHTYMTWLTKTGSPPSSTLVVHTNRGNEFRAAYASTSGGWDYYTPQVGSHYKWVRQHTSSPNQFEVRMLTGETLVYNSSGRLSEVWDTMATPNKVLLTYDGNGQVSTVTDASGKRRLLFSYTTNQLSSVAFQINTGTWTTQHTTTYAYASGNLSTVTIGGQLAQTNNYTSNYLTQIQDGAGNVLINFIYDSTTAGKVVRIDTPRGTVGWEYGSSRAACSGQTVLYFHLGNSTSCNVDSDCGSGYLCGGKTGTGSTGKCFRAARCMTVASVPEDVVTTVTALGPPSESCDGACLDVSQYIWDGGYPSPALDLTATQDPAGNYISRHFNSNGLPDKIVYGDTDGDPISGGTRIEYRYYDSTNPGLVTEIRRKSDLSTATCDASISTGCAQTIFGYTSGKLTSIESVGYTKNSSGNNVSYRNVTTITYDSSGKGRIYEVDGPLSGTGDLTHYDYWSSTDVLRDGFLQDVKRYKSATEFVTWKTQDHDFWGNPTTLLDPNDVVTCLTFDTARGFLKERRQTMAGQSDCATSNGADITATWDRDSALRLTKLTRPDGSCLIYEYDSRGRLSKTKRRDDCNAASSGEREEFTYSLEGLLTKTETFDAANTVTRRQELTYFDSRRLEKQINPVDTSKWTGLAYDARGLVNDAAATNGMTNYSRTHWEFDADARVSAEKRYTTSTAFDTWNLLYDWIGDQSQVTDSDSKVTKSVRDDLGRVVQLESPDLGLPILRVYNEANQLVTIKEDLGRQNYTHSFTFDLIGRPLDADYSGTCSGVNNPDIVRAYDQLPTGVTCPITGGCNQLKGRLAYVKVKLMCSTGQPDNSIDQETFYSYDDAGRLLHEYIKDDTGRTADTVIAWTKNGAMSQITLPSTTVLGATFDSAGSNSDKDRITALWRTSTSTPIIDNILWAPYGPVQQYNQYNTSAGTTMRTRITRNLAYRVTAAIVEKQTGGALHQVTIGEDEKGRVKSRDYYPSDPQISGRADSFYLYDLSDRVLCENKSLLSSCPTTGTGYKNVHSLSPPFTAAGDWKRLLRPIPGSSGKRHNFTLSTGTHQIATIDQDELTPALGVTALGYDILGDRISDDNTTTLTHDRRDYTYDSRRNVINVRGEYYTGGAWHYYDVASAFDASNRRVFKSVYDETTLKTAQWYFYYDPFDRLTEIRYTPDTSATGTYSVFQLVWLRDRLVLYWQTDYPSATTSRRYVGTDETARPVDMWSWPATGNGSRVWTVNADAWGFDTVLIGSTVFQPILFAGQYKDDETIAWQNDGATIHRPGVVANGYRTYDPWDGAYLQVDPMVDSTWSSYVYVDSDPVGKRDISGRAIDLGLSISLTISIFGNVFGVVGTEGEFIPVGCGEIDQWSEDPTMCGGRGGPIDPYGACNWETCKNQNYDSCACRDAIWRCDYLSRKKCCKGSQCDIGCALSFFNNCMTDPIPNHIPFGLTPRQICQCMSEIVPGCSLGLGCHRPFPPPPTERRTPERAQLSNAGTAE